MYLLILTLLLAAGACEAEQWQQLTCPYAPKHLGMPRVWCRPSSADCCIGLSFGEGAHVVDGGRLKVTQGRDSFTVAVLQPSRDDEGMHWCGVLDRNGTIIKLAEGYLHGSSGAFIWSVTRWILMPLLPIVTIIMNIYSRTSAKHIHKQEDKEVMSRLGIDPELVNSASSTELE